MRVRGELISEGFQVEVMDGLKGTESRGWLEQLAEACKADAVVAILGDETLDSVEVWVVDKVTERTVVRRIPFQPQSDHAPKTFAIHTLELLRASFLEIDLRPGSRPSQAKSVPPAVAHFVDSERPPSDSERPTIDQDASVSRSVARRSSGLATSGQRSSLSCALVGPSGRRWSPRLLWLGTVRKLACRTDVASAQVTEEFALLGASYRFVLGRYSRPSLSLAAGALQH